MLPSAKRMSSEERTMLTISIVCNDLRAVFEDGASSAPAVPVAVALLLLLS
jgi:hypothetical protein